MKELTHLCVSCKHGKMFEAEGVKQIYVSFGCKFKDTNFHQLIVRLPISDYVVECPKYEKASVWIIIRRKLLWKS